jgi:Polyketide cyclase / dehydrase and lipid transport
MPQDPLNPVSVSRRIEAPADAIFRILADPAQHPVIDGSGMLREGAPATVIRAIGDIFPMNMHNSRLGDYLINNHVVAFEADRCISWEPSLGAVAPEVDAPVAVGDRGGQRWSFELTPDGPGATVVTETYDCSRASERIQKAVDGGKGWLDGMRGTLENLDQLCRQAPS